MRRGRGTTLPAAPATKAGDHERADGADHRHVHRHRAGDRTRRARAGWRTVATMRDSAVPTSCSRPPAPPGSPRSTYAASTSPSRLGERLRRRRRRRYGRLDAVVNNAGAGHIETPMETDSSRRAGRPGGQFFGVVAVTRAALPHLRARRRSADHRLQRRWNRRSAVQRGVLRREVRRRGVHGEPRPGRRHGRRAGDGRRTGRGGGSSSTTSASTRRTHPAAILRPALRAYLARTEQAFADAQSPAEAAAVVRRARCRKRTTVPGADLATAPGVHRSELADLDGAAVARMTGGWLA